MKTDGSNRSREFESLTLRQFTKGTYKMTDLKPDQRIKTIVKWLKAYARSAKIETLVVGISGGIDSSVVSTLCAKTGLKTIAVQMPIRQAKVLDNRSDKQAIWLCENFTNVTIARVNLNSTFSAFEKSMNSLSTATEDNARSELAFANSRARLRMMTLYQIAQSQNGIVVGTGNKVEDFGVGFFTKYGDGGVDVSPIADCMKTDVWDMGRVLGIPQEIIDAPPTDGLWADGRTDQDQLSMTYPELELAMIQDETNASTNSSKEKKNLSKYRKIRAANLHKMLPIPVCKFQ